MLENVELSYEDKRRLKIVAAQEDVSMKDLILARAHDIIDNNDDIPAVDRAHDYVTLIINIPEDFKREVKLFCIQKDIRIRDLWVECCRRILEEFEDGEH